MIRALVFATLFVACSDPEPKQPPPVVLGKCLPDFYVSDRVKNQKCIFQGYVWTCEDDGYMRPSCQRGPEASGELPK